jgi:hypothetical protein
LYLVLIAAAALMMLLAAGCQSTAQDTGNDGASNAQSDTVSNSEQSDPGDDSTGSTTEGYVIEDVPDYMIKGDPDAPVTMEEWADFQ